MRLLVATVQVPFVRGGAEMLAEGLIAALREAGHEAEVVAIPFKWYPPERIAEQVLACRLLDLTESAGVKVDRVIGLKFPAYLVPHPNKVLWLLHQHRSAYELWDSDLGDLVTHPNGPEVRDFIRRADLEHIPEAQRVFTISRTVSARLERYCGIKSEPLLHPPPGAERFETGPPGDYFFFPSRLWPTKRQALVIEALAHASLPVRVRFAGAADDDVYASRLQAFAEHHQVRDRVEFLGSVDEATKRALYRDALAVLFPPAQEDYGYVTLEAMLAGKAVVTCSDSGGPLELVRDGETGVVVEPSRTAFAAALDALWTDRERARALGAAGRARYDALDISWRSVVEALTA